MGSCMFSPSSITSDLSNVLPANSYNDDYIAMLNFEDYPLGLQDPPEWICEGKFHLPCQQHSCKENMNMSEDVGLLPLVFPGLDLEVDRELSIFHLLKAHREAIEMGFVGLAQVILTRLHEKASPVGTTMERLSHYLLIQQSNPQFEYLKEECLKNYNIAFRAFYEITPYGRFAHFVANTAIHESVPRDVEAVHIIDFGVRDGIQWPPLLSALGPQRLVRITCIDMEEDYGFGRTKERLAWFAQTMGLKLRVDRMGLEELYLEKKRLASIGACEREWMVFNCMVGLPHMGMANMKGKSQIEQFMEVAQELVASSGRSGILTYGNGSSCHFPLSDGHLLHSHALFESMEWHFPSNLSLARTTMECLFVGASVSSCFESLDELLRVEYNLKGCRVSKQNIMEAKEIVRGGNYGVKVSRDGGNEMILEWRGTPLVRVCAWR